MDELITMQLANENCDEYLAYTVDTDGELLTILMLDNKIVGIFKHIMVHDRFYCDSYYGDTEQNYEFAERIDTILAEQAEQDDFEN